MSVQRISSFKTFTEVKNQQASIKMHEENKAKRDQLLSKIGQALEEEGVTSFDELDEEKRTALVAKIFNEDRAKDIEAAKVKMGQPKQLQSKEEEKEEENLEEGNAFIYAAAKAKADGKSEFEFNGKTYKVTLKTDTSLKESTMIITEGTRGFFGKIDKSGNIEAVYTHYDSYPGNMLPLIKKGYKNVKAVDAVLAKGDNSGLLTDINKMNFYGGENSKPMKGKVNAIKVFLKNADSSGAEYVYLYDERDNTWYMNDLHKSSPELVPAFESLEIEGDDLNEGRSINKIQGEWSKITAEMAAKAKDFKAAEGDAKAKILDELKALTAKKKALEAELDAAISDKDKDLELAVSESIEFEIMEAEDFAGWIAFYNGKKLEIRKDEANGIYAAKQIAIKKLNVPKSKEGILAIAPAYESVEVNEEIDIHNVLSDLMNKLQVKIGNLLHAAKGDSDWVKELNAIKKSFETLEDRISIAAKKLGMIDGVMKESVKIDEALSSEQKTVETFLKKIAKEFDYSIEDAARFVKDTISKMGLNESVVNEALFGSKDLDKTLVTYATDMKADEIYIISVNKVIDSFFPDLSTVEDKRFRAAFGMMLEADWLKQYHKLPKVGDILPAPKKDKAFESNEVNESSEYVGWVEYKEGKKLVDTFKDQTAAEKWNKANVDKLLDDEKIEKVGIMPKSTWDKEEAKYAIKESTINETDIKSDEEFTEYATKLLKNAFGDEFDEAKAKEVIDGILSKADGDYGDAVGMIQSSLD